ncbi:hypothetical protein GCM10010172_01460 [Paractinoplanes ferrugineus]|uniref:LPXTG-motif cell wall-anchored protein n=1 Tax=Paractinoplanes ferrugineus TaxID=113564 RepID=A0A919J6N5_9ACTN|nr:hypothetical protein [Actinoplanes ferrugineus]GIE13993.1 hypothetical protein Afe05nite_58330 [Actinoplanes ferrugineus]
MRLRHFAIPAAIELAALTGLATPAVAAPEQAPTLQIVAPYQVAVIEGKTKSVTATVVNISDTTAKKVAFGFGKVDPAAGLILPDGCTGKVDTACAIGDLAPGASRKFTFKLKPDAATGTDLTSSLALLATGAANVAGAVQPMVVVRAKGGVDLEVADIDDMKLNRGQTADVPVTVRNAGSESVDALGVVLIGEEQVQTLSKYRNCVAESEEGVNTVVCLFEGTFAAGAEFTVPSATPLQVKLASTAGGPFTYTAAAVAVGVNKSAAASLAKKSGPELSLKEAGDEGDYTDVPDDLNDADNTAVFGIKVAASTADSAAIGATFTGAVGDSSTVKVGVRNLGPTAVIPANAKWAQYVEIKFPTGVNITKYDSACQLWLPRDPSTPTDNTWFCLVPSGLGVDRTALFSFTGTLAGTKFTPGYVIVDGGVQDNNLSNDRAEFGINPTAGGEGGGGGLPLTGAPAGWVAAGGALLLIVGAIFFTTARRRRIITKA